MKMSFICMIIKNVLHKKDFALSFVLKQRLSASLLLLIKRIAVSEDENGLSCRLLVVCFFSYDPTSVEGK